MHMSEMIDERRSSSKEERHDVFSNLLAASDENMDDATISKSEIIGASNSFTSEVITS